MLVFLLAVYINSICARFLLAVCYLLQTILRASFLYWLSVSRLAFYWLSNTRRADFYWLSYTTRAGNSLIGFLSKLLKFCEEMSEWAICSQKRAIRSFAHFWWVTWAIRSWSLIFGERPERIAHGHLFLVNDLSNSLTSLIFGTRPEPFAHIAH